MKTYITPSVKIHNVNSRNLIATSEGSTDGTIDDMGWASKDRHSGSDWKDFEN